MDNMKVNYEKIDSFKAIKKMEVHFIVDLLFSTNAKQIYLQQSSKTQEQLLIFLLLPIFRKEISSKERYSSLQPTGESIRSPDGIVKLRALQNKRSNFSSPRQQRGIKRIALRNPADLQKMQEERNEVVHEGSI
jgi:hypothetical protein